MNLYHIKLTDNKKDALEHLFSQDVTWNKTELEKAWDELREQVRGVAQGVAIINALRGTGCNCKKPTKYDPNREFREGDKVRVRKIHGKLPQCRYNGMVKVKEGDCCTIHKKEGRNCYWVTIPSGGNRCFDAAYFELLNPVEEIEPYSVEEETLCWVVLNERIRGKAIVCEFVKKFHPNAQAAAETECRRLNAEHRKEQE